MVLKRQTVWLLTMLSLIIVLSVYYISMDRMQDHQAFLPEDEQESEDEGLEINSEDGDITLIELQEVEEVLGEGSFFSGLSVHEMFSQIRLQRTDTQGRLRDDLMSVVASAEASPEAQVRALEQVENMYAMQQKEEMVENLLRSEGYEDALVIADEFEVKIYVKADELSKEEADKIMGIAHEHLGVATIRVGFQSNN